MRHDVTVLGSAGAAQGAGHVGTQVGVLAGGEAHAEANAGSMLVVQFAR